MVSVEDRPTNLARVVVLPLPNLRSDLIRRPGEGLRFGKPMSCAARNPLNSPCQAATAAEARKRQHARKRCGRKDEKRNDTCFHIPHTIG